MHNRESKRPLPRVVHSFITTMQQFAIPLLRHSFVAAMQQCAICAEALGHASTSTFASHTICAPLISRMTASSLA
jgi:hypothetical protein